MTFTADLLPHAGKAAAASLLVWFILPWGCTLSTLFREMRLSDTSVWAPNSHGKTRAETAPNLPNRIPCESNDISEMNLVLFCIPTREMHQRVRRGRHHVVVQSIKQNGTIY
ncbi:hypothetical protein FKM82_021517 [Ascaphus truei]